MLISQIIFGFFIYFTAADITDMPSEAVCAAQCLTNFTASLATPEREFLRLRPDLTEPHCINKRGNCSVCLEVCRWSSHNTSRCAASCERTVNNFQAAYPNAPAGEQMRTCVSACTFLRRDHAETEAILAGRKEAVCPLSSSWPEDGACKQKTCTSDADCLPARITKCCRADACTAAAAAATTSLSSQTLMTTVPTLVTGGPQQDSRPSIVGVCMQVVTTTLGVPPVPGRPSVRQSLMKLAEPDYLDPQIAEENRRYQLELDWSEYYNNSAVSVSRNSWTFPAVFLVQLRIAHEMNNTLGTGFPGLVGSKELPVSSDWRSLVWTTKLGAALSDLSPGTWYQFRLMAASGAGFGGISAPSEPIKIRALLMPPSAPRNLTEGTSRIYANKIEIRVYWDAPIVGSDSLKFYKITWRKHSFQSLDESSLAEYMAKVPKNAKTYTIRDLEPETVYRVQVTAVSLVEDKELVSQPALRYLKTVPIPISSRSSSFASSFGHGTGKGCRCGSQGENRYLVQSPFFEDGSLKAVLTIPPSIIAQYFGPNVKETAIFSVVWHPQVCIETQYPRLETSMSSVGVNIYKSGLVDFNLRDLRFQCHYRLRVQSMEERGKMLSLCFCTPSCKDVHIRSGAPPANCSSPDGQIPHGPIEVGYQIVRTDPPITHLFGQVSSKSDSEPIYPIRSGLLDPGRPNSGLSAIISWKPYSEALLDHRFLPLQIRSRQYMASSPGVQSSGSSSSRGYRVIWGPRLVEPIEPGMYSSGIAPQLDPAKTESKVVDAVNKVMLRNLEPDTLYIVQVQTIGIHADSPASSVFFTTPKLNSDGKNHSSRPLSGFLFLIFLSPLLIVM